MAILWQKLMLKKLHRIRAEKAKGPVSGPPDRFLKRVQRVDEGNNASPPGLSSTFCQPKRLNDSVFELYAPESAPQLEIVFFHGLQFSDYCQAYLKAWMSQDDSECWPMTWLKDKFPGARVLAVSYDASVQKSSQQGRMSLINIGENLVADLLQSAKVGQQWQCPVILVGHCLGGLVIEQLCIEVEKKLRLNVQASEQMVMRNFFYNVKGVFYYATPHGGSRVVDYAKNMFSGTGPTLRYLEILSADSERLSQQFTACRKKYRWKTAAVAESFDTHMGQFKGMVVEEASARHGIDPGQFLSVRADHISVCKPEGPTSSSFQHLILFMANILREVEVEKDVLDLQLLESIPKYAVGLEPSVREILKLLGSSKSVGIGGIGGIGKTTLARAVFHKISQYFEYTCFIPDVNRIGGTDQRRELEKRMQENLRYSCGKLEDETSGWATVEGKRVLLVLDDVDDELQLSYIPKLADLEWFGEGSKLVVISREQRILSHLDAYFELNGLDGKESEQLFISHSFQSLDAWQQIPTSLKLLVKSVARTCSGVPLALEVVGRHLRKEEDEGIWRDALTRLNDGEFLSGEKNDRLRDSLMMSYDGLDSIEKEMFLDAAIPFQNIPVQVSLAVEIWNASWELGNIGWQTLRRKCLVKGDEHGRIWMHEQLRHLARSIACPRHASVEEWTRVGNPAKAEELLTSCEGTSKKVQGLVLDQKRAKNLQVAGNVFLRYPQLRVLTLQDVSVEGKCLLPESLVCLRWFGGQFVECPVIFERLKNLGVLELRNCEAMEKLPPEVALLKKLRWLELEGCKALRELPSGLQQRKLKHVGLKGTSLTHLPDELGKWTQLQSLQLSRCTNLTLIPKSLGNLHMLKSLDLSQTGVTTLPDSVGSLHNLERLSLSDTILSLVPESLCKLQNLSYLSLANTCISELPRCFGNLKMLTKLNLSGTSLNILPGSFANLSHLRELDLRKTEITHLHEWVGELKELVELCLSDTKLEVLPESIGKLANLQRLYLSRCKNLRQLPESFGNLSSLDTLVLYNSTEQKKYPESFCRLPGVTKLKLPCIQSLKGLYIVELQSGRTPSEEFYQSWKLHTSRASELNMPRFSRVHTLQLHDCENVKELPRSLLTAFQHLPSLRKLTLVDFVCVESLSDDFGDCLSKLEGLGLWNWARLRSLPESVGCMTKLQHIGLIDLPSLINLPETVGRLANLEILHMLYCKKFQSFPQSIDQLSSLVRLYLEDLPALKTLPSSFGRLPSLTHLYLGEKTRLQSLPKSFGELTNLTTMIMYELHLLQDMTTYAAGLSNLTLVYPICCEKMERLRNTVGADSQLTARDVVEILKPENVGTECADHIGGYCEEDTMASKTRCIHGSLARKMSPKFQLKLVCLGPHDASIRQDVLDIGRSVMAVSDDDVDEVEKRMDLASNIWSGFNFVKCPGQHGSTTIDRGVGGTTPDGSDEEDDRTDSRDEEEEEAKPRKSLKQLMKFRSGWSERAELVIETDFS